MQDNSQDQQSETARRGVSGADSTSTWAALGDNMLECDSQKRTHRSPDQGTLAVAVMLNRGVVAVMLNRGVVAVAVTGRS